MASLAKWLSIRLQTKWLWVRIQLQPPDALFIFDKYRQIALNKLHLLKLVTKLIIKITITRAMIKTVIILTRRMMPRLVRGAPKHCTELDNPNLLICEF